jgi:hypothetical protein
MCSIDEAWAGQTFGGKSVVSQSDIHNAYMSIPDDITTHNNQFSFKYNGEQKPSLSRGINSKLTREARVPKINRNSNNANINFSSTMPPYNNYAGVEPRPDYMQIYDTAGPSPVMTGEQFSDISSAYNVSNTTNDFMARGEAKLNSLLNEDNELERKIINIKNNNKKMNNMNNFANIKQISKYNSSDSDSYDNSYSDSNNSSSNDTQILIILQQVINKLDNLEYNMNSLHNHKTKNMYDIILYILFGMILSFILCSIFSSKK